MNIKERASYYKKYISTVDNNEALDLLSKSFDITQDDVNSDISDITDNASEDPIAVTAAKFNILMADLRDMRDSKAIKKSRRDILSSAFSNTETPDTSLIFPV